MKVTFEQLINVGADKQFTVLKAHQRKAQSRNSQPIKHYNTTYTKIGKSQNKNYKIKITKMKITKLLLGLLMIGTFNTHAQSPEEMMDSFFKTYQKNKPIEALEELYSHTPWLERIKDDVEKLKTQFRDLKTIVGEYNGHELLYKKNVKESFILATFLVKYDRQPIRINFEFYKPKDKWILYSFSYDDSFDDDIEKAMQYQILEMTK